MKLSRPSSLFPIFCLFLASGFTALIYESLWSKYLTFLLGYSTFGQSLILILFMGGLSLGSLATTKYLHQKQRFLLWYALIEIALGILALTFHPVYQLLTQSLPALMLSSDSIKENADAFKILIAALMILPQCVLLGATFPLIAAACNQANPQKQSSHISILYFVNSLGASLGVFTCGFILIEHLYLEKTLLLAGLINIGIGLASLLIQKKLLQEESPSDGGEPLQDKTKWDGLGILMLASAFFTGCASFMYEIGWIRIFSILFGSSNHSFEIILCAFILGMALGGLWIRLRGHKIKNHTKYLFYAQILMATLALLSIHAYEPLFQAMSALDKDLTVKNDETYLLFHLGRFTMALVVMLPVTFFAGMTLPLTTINMLRNGYNRKAIGWIYAVNTIGCILGVMIAMNYFMTEWSKLGVVLAGGILDILIALALLAWLIIKAKEDGTLFVQKKPLLTACVITYAALFLLSLSSYPSTGKSFDQYYMPIRGKIFHEERHLNLYQKDGKSATITAFFRPGRKQLFLATNNKPDASINMVFEKPLIDESTQDLLAILPMAIHGSPEKAAVVGFGSGITSHTILALPTIQQVDTIEIEPSIVEAARVFYPKNRAAYDDPRNQIVFDDARSHFTWSQKKYDIIISEPSNTWVSGVSSLFTLEFYRIAAKALKKDGVFAQWMHLYRTDMTIVASILKALGDVFGNYRIFALNKFDIMIIASPNKEDRLDIKNLFLDNRPLTALMGRHYFRHLGNVSFLSLGEKEILAPYFNSFSVPSNSDFKPYVSSTAEKANFLNKNAYRLLKLRTWFPPENDPSRRDYLRTHRWLHWLDEQPYWGSPGLLSPFKKAYEMLAVTDPSFAHKSLKVDLHKLCQNGDRTQIDQWVRQAFIILKSTMSYLKPNEQKSLIASLQSQLCYPFLSQHQKRVFSTLKALNEGSFESAAEMSNEALKAIYKAGPLFDDFRLTIEMQLIAGLLRSKNLSFASKKLETLAPFIKDKPTFRMKYELLFAYSRELISQAQSQQQSSERGKSTNAYHYK